MTIMSKTDQIITENEPLKALCDALAKESYITVDTEFLRDRTYYPKLCLIQVAAPEGLPMAIDPLVKGLDLSPFYELMRNQNVLKIFHAARQDMEIFFHEMEDLPQPIFDTQVAAMVCGYGEQIGYLNLIHDICGHTIDKGPQFTDWSRRPLSAKQLNYALDDVTYLRDAYLHLEKRLDETGRTAWVKQEMDVLRNTSTYENLPEESWGRIKVRSQKPRVYCVLQAAAAWREREAQRRNAPRNRVIRDEAIADIAIHPPQSKEELKKIRNMPSDLASNQHGEALLKEIQNALQSPKGACPVPDKKEKLPQDLRPVLEMLKMLLRIQASDHEVAVKLIASSDDLEQLAMRDDANIPALKGWRYEIFGQDALDLKHGKIALGLKDGHIIKIKS